VRKQRNDCFPRTILFPLQFQLSSAPGDPLVFKPDSADYVFKIFPAIADSTMLVCVFTKC
jgi:hypothetical protein